MQSFFQRHRVFLLHFSFWCVYLSFFVYQITSFRRRETELGEAFVQAGVQVAFHMLVAYLNYFFFLPRFLETKKIGRYLLEFSIPFAMIMFLRVHLQRYMIDGYTYHEHYFYSTVYWVQLVAVTLFIVIFVGMLRFAKDWFEFEAKKKEVENEKLTEAFGLLLLTPCLNAFSRKVIKISGAIRTSSGLPSTSNWMGILSFSRSLSRLI